MICLRKFVQEAWSETRNQRLREPHKTRSTKRTCSPQKQLFSLLSSCPPHQLTQPTADQSDAVLHNSPIHREKGFRLDVNSLYYWVLITHVTLLPPWLNPSSDCHGSPSRLLRLPVLGSCQAMLSSHALSSFDHPRNPKSDNRKSPPPGFELRTSRETALRFNAPAAVHSAKASMPVLHREKGYRLDVNSLYYWVVITHVTKGLVIFLIIADFILNQYPQILNRATFLMKLLLNTIFKYIGKTNVAHYISYIKNWSLRQIKLIVISHRFIMTIASVWTMCLSPNCLVP